MMAFWNNVTFVDRWAFGLLVIPLLLLLFYLWRHRQRYPELTWSSLIGVAGLDNSLRGTLRSSLFFFRILVLCLLILAMARPQSFLNEEQVSSEGIDIVLAMDISGSMLARDFKPDRLGAAKEVATSFIRDRPEDRIGLVVFAGESFTQCPITTDHLVLLDLLDDIKSGMIEDGTAIGMGLATAVNRLKDSDTKSKVIILLTDGVNNAGFIDPITATDAAIQFGARVYTIGVGTKGMAPYPMQMGNRTVYREIEVRIDEELLQEIAQLTGGKYFRATDNESLKEIYDEIDTLEKSKIQVASISRQKEEFYPLALAAAVLLLFEFLMRHTFLRSIP